MSSLHQDRPLAEDPKPTKGARRIPAPAQGKTRTPAATTGEKAPDIVPTPRSGKAQSRTSQTTPTRKPARAAGTSAKSTTGARTAAAGSSTAAPRTTRATGAARAAKAKAAPKATAAAKPTAAKPTRKATAAKPATAKNATAKKATPEQAAKPQVTSAPAEAPVEKKPRPTPYKRPAVDGDTPAEVAPLVAAEVDVADLVETAETRARDVVAGSAEGGRGRFLRRSLRTARRRPALYLAAALVGALGVSLTTAEPQTAKAETATVSQSVSVAEELGIELEAQPIEEITPEAAAESLGDLAASRTERDAEQAEAAQVQAEADRAAAEAAAAAAAEAARPDAVLPVDGARLTSGFGPRWGTLHGGIDLAAPMMTPEYAAMDGIVLEAGPASGFGNAVYIQHENGDVTVYGHMEQILVTAGQVVKAGDTIALLGNRGQSTGPHLHFEVHVGGIDGTKIDPIPWLRERGVNI
jgi:murein DD-endopeptidase MepM/ murein hydrolase activator NlpD